MNSLNKIICNKDLRFVQRVIKFINFQNRGRHCIKVHTQKLRQGYCNEKLLEFVKNPPQKIELIPFKKYCSTHWNNEKKLSRKEFEVKCELRRQRHVSKDTMCDVYDKKIWKDFNDAKKIDFFTKPRKYGLMVNLDWFCPYQHIKNSCSWSVLFNSIKFIKSYQISAWKCYHMQHNS